MAYTKFGPKAQNYNFTKLRPEAQNCNLAKFRPKIYNFTWAHHFKHNYQVYKIKICFDIKENIKQFKIQIK